MEHEVEEIGAGPGGAAAGVAVRSHALLPGASALVGRGVVQVTLAMLAAVLWWSAVTETDVVVRVRGRTTVAGEPVRVAAPEAGLVATVDVAVGDHVRAGAPLLALDAREHAAAAERLQAEIRVVELEVERHRREIDGQRAERDALQRERCETVAIDAQYGELIAGRRELLDRGIAAPTELLELERARREVAIRIARVDAQLAALDDAAGRARQLADEAAARIDALRVERAQALARVERSTLRAPCDGVVAELAVRHAGDRLAIDAPAAVVLPDGSRLVLCVQVPNAAMRRLRPGLPARIELDAFPRADHGTLAGCIERIEPDADELGQYVGWVAFDGADLAAHPAIRTRLQTGLLATVRIRVDRRTVLALLAEPLTGRRHGIELAP
ncbi:MAG: HlyD family efflux transporter periplasmic adaptor subunit [Planctomycetes bacterium]|nr:HlyD family efflux transporter periplasmic adaptor subunit [Planctomycetota bacterium]